MFSTGTLIKQDQDLTVLLRQGEGYATNTVYLVRTLKVSTVVMVWPRVNGYRFKLDHLAKYVSASKGPPLFLAEVGGKDIEK